MKFYIISDTHFGHDKIINWCQRPQNHEDLMIQSMAKISHQDCLIHLGDFCIVDDLKWHKKLEYVSCRRILVLGNHDSKSYSWYMNNGWHFACDSLKIQYAGYNVCLSHKPQSWDGDWEVNVHGHLHNLGHRDHEFRELKKWHKLYAPELFNYQPIELAKLIQQGMS